ncbi:MAG: translocation/assembly module TamB domain-containing protein [Deltaproteobacteria bacterium]|nr:translocation/assembly module TamB domain-containing protein [Deltaproteobacteria bacterium]
MRRVLVRIAKAVLVLCLVVLVAVLAAVGLLFSPPGERWVKHKVLDSANASLAGTVELDALELAPGGRIRLTGVRLLDPHGELVASIARVDARVQLLALLQRRAHVLSLELSEPTLRIREDPDGRTNFATALSTRAPASSAQPPTPMRWTVLLDDVVLERGLVALHLANAPPMRVQELALSGSAKFGPDVLVTALTVTGAIEEPERAPLSLRVSAHGSGLTPDGELVLDEVRLRAGSSTLEAHGQLARGEGQLAVEATISRKLAAALGVPLGSDLSAQLHGDWKKGQPANVTAAVPLEPGGAWLDAQLWPAAHPLRYTGRIRLDRLDPSKLIQDAPHGDLTGELELGGHGTSLAELSLQVKTKLQPSRLQGIAINGLTLRGEAHDEVFTLEALHLDAPGGTFSGRGRASMKELALDVDAHLTDLRAFTSNLGASEPYAGSATGALHLGGTPHTPSLQLELHAPRVANSRMELDVHQLVVQGMVADLRRPRQLRAHLRAERGHFQGEELVGFSGNAELDGARYHVDLTSAGPSGLTAHAIGQLPDAREVMSLTSFELSHGAWRWILQDPATVDLSHGAVASRMVLRSGDQELVLEGGLARRRFDVRAAITALDLAQLPALVVPTSVGLRGRVTGTVSVRGPINAVTVEAHANASGVTVERLAQRPGAVLAGTVDAVLARKRSQLHAHLAAGLTQLQLDLDTPFSSDARPDAPLTGRAQLQNLDLGDVAALLGLASDQHLAGMVGGAATLTGTWEQPALDARLALNAVSLRGTPPISGTARLETSSRAALMLDLRSGVTRLHGTTEASLPPEILRRKRPLSELATLNVQTDLALDALDLNRWRTPLRLPREAHGLAQAKLSTRGTLSDPRGSAELVIQNLSLGGLGHAQLELRATADSQLTLHGELVQAQQKLAHLDGMLATSLSTLRARPDSVGSVAAQAKLVVDAPELANVGALSHLAARGSAELNAELHGTLDAPVIHVDLQGRQVMLSGARVGDVDAGLDYAGSVSRAHAKLAHLELSGELRHDLGLGALREGARLGEAQISARLNADHFDLAALSGLDPAASTLAGTLTAQVQLDGPLGAPTVRGHADVDNGRLVLSGLGDFHPITLRFQADDHRLAISQLEVHADAGWAKLTAEALRSGNTGPFTLRGELHAQGFPVRYQDQVMGKVDLDGSIDGSLTPKSPLIQLHIAKAQAQVPQLTHRDVQSLDPNPDIVILGRRSRRTRVARAAPGSSESGAMHVQLPPPPGPQIRLGIYAPHEVAIKGSDIDLSVQGQLGVLLEPLGEKFVQIIAPPGGSGGSYIQATHGWVSVIGRKFEVRNDKIARVDFLGGPPTNAMLDVAMVFNDRADDIVVTVELTGPLTKPNPPALSSQPQMDQSQLALLIATGHLQPRRGAGAVTAANQAGSVLGSLLAGALQRSVARSLPIDTVSVQTSAQGQIRAEVGKYVTDRIYIGYTHNFTADILPGSLENQDLNINELSLQYQLSRRWQLEAVGGESMGAFNAIWQKDF